MKKATLLLAALALIAGKSLAQNASASAAQQTSLSLANAIVLSFTTTGSSNVNVNFASLQDMNNGVETIDHQVLVQSNLPFDVDVTTPTNFSYAGSYTSNTTMPVVNKFKMKIMDNSTGGTNAIGSGFSNVTGNLTTLFTNCPAGGNATFDIRYKLIPGPTYSPGIYSMNVVYTATQL